MCTFMNDMIRKDNRMDVLWQIRKDFNLSLLALQTQPTSTTIILRNKFMSVTRTRSLPTLSISLLMASCQLKAPFWLAIPNAVVLARTNSVTSSLWISAGRRSKSWTPTKSGALKACHLENQRERSREPATATRTQLRSLKQLELLA